MTEETPPADAAVRFQMAARFQRIVNKIARMSQGARDFGTGEPLTAAEIQSVHLVGNRPGITVTELARRLGLTKGSVSPIVNRLVERGYIEKERSDRDGRRLKLSLTAKGRIAADGYESYAREYVSHYASEISPGEWMIVNEILGKLESFIDSKMGNDG